MDANKEEELLREDVKKEFQLERVILFSDAVFAIVITLMAIEIRLPEMERGATSAMLFQGIIHLLPTILAYATSFAFIGMVWYQHLRLFGLLKNYDKGLIVRNLVLLFCVGLFPFSATVITRGQGSVVALFVYMGIILLCLVAQVLLQHYVLIKAPQLRLSTDITEHMAHYRKRRTAAVAMSATLITIFLLSRLLPSYDRPLAMLGTVMFPVAQRVWKMIEARRVKRSVSAAKA